MVMLYRMVRPAKRKGSSNFVYVRRIPVDVRDAAVRLGRLDVPVGGSLVTVRITPSTQAIRLSLGTSEPREVKSRNAAVDAYLENVWRALRQHEPAALTHRQAVALSGELYRAWANEGGERRIALVHNLETNLWERDDTPPLPNEHAAEWEAVMRNLEELGGEPDELEPVLGPIVDRLLLAKGMGQIDEPTHAVILYEFRHALRDAFAARKRNAEGDYSPDPKAERFPPWEAPSGSQGRSPVAVGASLAGLVEDWWKENKAAGLAISTYESYRNTMRRFVAFLGHDDPARVVPDDVIRFKDYRLGEGVSPKTIKDSDLAGLRRVFGWAVTNHRIPSNPAQGISIKIGKKERLRSKGFKEDEARDLLRHALGYRRTNKKEHSKTAAAKRWAPWLCAYTGARVGEILQLRKQDVRSEGGHWIITITPEAGTVKNKELREIPLHSHLGEIGFGVFVEGAPDGYLFLNVKPGADPLGARRTTKNRVREFAREVVTDRRVAPNHGWRHLFKTIGIEADIQERVLDAICGHAPRTVGAAYGDVTLKAKADALAKFPRFKVGTEGGHGKISR
jgi:integrase